MSIQIPLLFHPVRKFFGSSDDRTCVRKAPDRSLLFQVVESELCAADALLDLNDTEGFDHHFWKGERHSQDLEGPEYILMHQRLSRLRDKRSNHIFPG